MELVKTAQIRVDNEWIDIKIPVSVLKNARARTKDWRILAEVRGIWKNKKIDALRFQRETREEWR